MPEASASNGLLLSFDTCITSGGEFLARWEHRAVKPLAAPNHVGMRAFGAESPRAFLNRKLYEARRAFQSFASRFEASADRASSSSEPLLLGGNYRQHPSQRKPKCLICNAFCGQRKPA